VIVEIYTRDGCPRCVQTKTLLSNNDVNYTEKKIGVDIERDAVLQAFPDQRSLPIVSVNGTVIPLTGISTLINTHNNK
jgi:glutaredoxin